MSLTASMGSGISSSPKTCNCSMNADGLESRLIDSNCLARSRRYAKLRNCNSVRVEDFIHSLTTWVIASEADRRRLIFLLRR
jgi:hypothetical protein